jgi:hypothetical protein
MLPLLCALALLGPSDPLVVRADAGPIDPQAVRHGVEIRLGDDARGWEVDISGDDPRRLDLRITPPGGEPFDRDVTLDGVTLEDRSRELSAVLVIMIEQHEVAEPTNGSGAAGAAARPSGFVAGAGHVAAGAPADVGVGAELLGGAWLLREHLQPWAEVGWIRAAARDLTVDGLRFGLGLAAGSALGDGRVWLGGAAIPRAVWTHARDATRASAWTSSTFVGALVQLRLHRARLVFLLRTGADLGGPPLRFRGNDDALRWGTVRFAASLGVGVSFGRAS